MTSLPRFLSENIFGNLVGSSSTQATPPTGVSRGFELFIQSINKAKSKYEENQIIQRELQTVEQNISSPNVSQVQMRELLCRLVYSHMLGYDVSCGHIHAVKLAQQGTQASKKMGYMTCCLLLHRDHDLILLLINTIQKDLKSSNLLDNMAALSAASQLVPADMIPTLLPTVLEKLKHQRAIVRQKAVMCLHQFYLLAPELMSHNLATMRKVIMDKDPAVVGTFLHILELDIQQEPEQHQVTGTLLVKILSQLSTAKMDPMFDYHGMSFPWLRIHLIRCLTKVASTHNKIHQDIASVLEMIMQRITLKENIAFALLYECILCIVTINPGPKLLNEAAKHVGRFLKSNDPNLKLIGVKALVRLIQTDKHYATQYQTLITQSLEDADTSIQRKMYTVLYEISHAGNVEAISTQMLRHMSYSIDRYWRSQVITMVIDMASRYTDNAIWQTDTLFTCLHLAAKDMDSSILDTVFATLEKGYMETHCDLKRQQVLVQKCVGVLAAKNTSPLVIQLAAWVLGELCGLLKNISEEKLLGFLIKHLCNNELKYEVKSHILLAIQKLLCNHVITHETYAANLRECLHVCQLPVIKQMVLMLLAVCQTQMSFPLPQKRSGMDTTLSFLDDYVSDHLEQGGKPYRPTHMQTSVASRNEVGVYTEQSEGGLEEEEEAERLSVEDRQRTNSTTSSTKAPQEMDFGLNLSGVKKVWCKQGRREELTDKPTNMTTVAMTTQEVQSESEEERRYVELSSALFAGLSSGEKIIPEEPLSLGAAGFISNTSDDIAWGSLHEPTEGASNFLDLSCHEDNYHYISNSLQFKDPSHKSSLQSASSSIDKQHDADNDKDKELKLFSIDDDGLQKSRERTSLRFEQSEAALSLQHEDTRSQEELSTLTNDNSAFLNISMCSSDDSKVSLSYYKGDITSETLGEVSMLNTTDTEAVTNTMSASPSDSCDANTALDSTVYNQYAGNETCITLETDAVNSSSQNNGCEND